MVEAMAYQGVGVNTAVVDAVSNGQTKLQRSDTTHHEYRQNCNTPRRRRAVSSNGKICQETAHFQFLTDGKN